MADPIGVFDTLYLLNETVEVGRHWNRDFHFQNNTYAMAATIKFPRNESATAKQSALAICAEGSEEYSRTALVTDGPIMSMESGAYFAGNVGIGTTQPMVRLDVITEGGAVPLPAESLGSAIRGFSGTMDGVHGISKARGGIGVYGKNENANEEGVGVWGESVRGYAGQFVGNVNVYGTLTKTGGGFKIDHPLDPENKYLSHSFVESPDMKNVYDGVTTLDERGEAVVELADWFETLNRDFRYQLTAIGGPAPNLHIAEEVASNRFRIAGGRAGMKVSWTLTGIRQDAWAEENRILVESAKANKDR